MLPSVLPWSGQHGAGWDWLGASGQGRSRGDPMSQSVSTENWDCGLSNVAVPPRGLGPVGRGSLHFPSGTDPSREEELKPLRMRLGAHLSAHTHPYWQLLHGTAVRLCQQCGDTGRWCWVGWWDHFPPQRAAWQHVLLSHQTPSLAVTPS